MRLGLTLCLLFVSLTGFSQMTGGGGGGTAVKAVSGGNPNKWRSLQFGLAQPIGKFKENNLTVPFNEAVGAKPGLFLSIEGNTYFSGTVNNPVKFGLSSAFGFNLNTVNWEPWVSGSTTFFGTPFLNAHYKLGVIGTYDISDDMSLDGFFRIGVGLGIGATGSWDSEEFYTETPAVGFAYGLGTNFRWQNLLATMQINPAAYNFDYISSSSSAPITYKVPMSTFWLGIGFVFKNKA